jgi:N-acetylmuramic acid 6-phosphate etherase
MVNLRAKNKKLFERALSIIEQIAQVDRDLAARTLESADRQVPVALLMLTANLSKRQAKVQLKSTGGIVHKAKDLTNRR